MPAYLKSNNSQRNSFYEGLIASTYSTTSAFSMICGSLWTFLICGTTENTFKA